MPKINRVKFKKLVAKGVDPTPFLDEFEALCDKYKINTKQRIAMFYGQLLHESGNLKYTKELWGPTEQQKRYERDFTQEWSKTNQRNKLAFILGNSKAGDGSKYRGCGLIQTTGAYNFKLAADYLGDQKIYTEGYTYASKPDLAMKMALFFWSYNNLNAIADTGDIVALTKKVNGGKNGLDHRIEMTRAMESCID